MANQFLLTFRKYNAQSHSPGRPDKGKIPLIQQDNITKSIGIKVRAARVQAAISRRVLAETAGVSERYLNKLEHGDANLSVGILARVANALAVNLASLLPATQGFVSSSRVENVVNADLAEVVGEMTLREQEAAGTILQQYLKDRRRSLRGIALLGLRGAGKSTIGGLLADRHGLPFVSVTREIEARAGISLNDLFNLGGPDAYRAVENEVVMDLVGRDDYIVLETAGGIVSNAPALEVILGSFKTIWLKAAPEEHLQRVIRQGDLRPVDGTLKALDHLKTLLSYREQEYARADLVLDTTGRAPEACVDELERIAGPVPSENHIRTYW